MSTAEATPLIVIAEVNITGSSRLGCEGTTLLGIKAVIATSFERIHRSNLVGMGILPLTFLEGEGPEILGLDGSESFDIACSHTKPGANITITATRRKASQSLSRPR